MKTSERPGRNSYQEKNELKIGLDGRHEIFFYTTADF